MCDLTYEDHHRVALARELTAAAGYPLRDQYGFAASGEYVLYVVNAGFAEPDDQRCGDLIGSANFEHRIEIAQCDHPATEAYEQGIITGLRPLAEDRRNAAARRL